MSHNLTSTDGMFTVREPSWHGLETAVFDEYPTREEAQRIAHPWEPDLRPLYREHPTKPGVFVEVDNWREVYRDDNKAGIGVVSAAYTPIRNEEMYDIAEAIENGDKGSVKFETGGSLKGGAKVWLLLRLAEPIVVAGDPNGATIPYYALQNSHDSYGSFRGQATMTRIVCDNTAQIADLDARARGTEFVFRHSKNVGQRIEEARLALAGWKHSIEEWKLLSEHLIGLTVTPDQRQEFIERFIPAPPPGMASDRVLANVGSARDELKFILDGSPTTEGIGLTAYGLVQGAIEYGQHYRKAQSKESAFKRAYLDRSQVAQSANALALAVVGA